MPRAVEDVSQYVWVALQVGCSQAGEVDEHICQTPLQPSQAQPADVSLPSSRAVATSGAAQNLLEPDEAMGPTGLQDQTLAVARAELQPGFIHQSLLQCARGNRLPAKTPLYGLFRTLQEGQVLMVYGTSLLNIALVTAFPSCCIASCLFGYCCLDTQTYQAQSTHVCVDAC